MKVLIAEDDSATRRVLKLFLEKWGYDVVEANDGFKAREILHSENPPQLAILDWMMPGMAGIDICREIRSQPDKQYPYMLLLTTKSQKDDIVEGLDSGADDYLLKPFEPKELKARIQAGRRILELQAQLRSHCDSLQTRATLDSLTGLWNRGEILNFLQAECQRARREGSGVGVIMLDLDHFKNINDTYGHPVGDEVLRAVAQRLSSALRPYDYIGRYGGEEFLIVVRDPDVSDLFALAERARLAVGNSPLEVSVAEIRMTLSIGVAFDGKDAETDGGGLIRAADAALYRAKRNGRNQVQMAHDPVLMREEPVAGR